jgi:predicted enzyme related to lactoylglutathione lyase
MEQMKPGLPCWMECMTTDLDKALAFYKGLFGWTTTTKPVDDGHIYHMFMNGSYGIGGLMQCPDKNIPSHWYPYFMSADLKTSADRAKSLGGTPIMPPTDIGEGMGSFSIQLDPAGAVFGFYSAAAGPAKTC